MTVLTTFVLASLSIVAAPAPAASDATATAPRVEQPAAQPNPNRTYCFKYEITGSILPQRTCKTYGEWMKEGIDPTAKR